MKIALAEGPLGELTTAERLAIEAYAKNIIGFDDAPEHTGEIVRDARGEATDYIQPLTKDAILASKFPAQAQSNIQYGQLAQAAAVAPAGKPGLKSLEKLLAETDWQKRRPQVMDALDEVFAEVKRSLDKHGGFRSGHEAYAVLLEEVDELWDEIKNDNSGGVEARTEAIQVAAMAVKYAVYIASRPEPINSANWTGLDGD